jgi:hypothetical protein
MKNCPICRRSYSDQTQFCTRDGTKLETLAEDLSFDTNAMKTGEYKIPIPAASTKKLELPRVPTMTGLTQYGLAEYASSDRRLIRTTAIFFILLVIGLGIYSLSGPSKRHRSASIPSSSNSEDQTAAEASSDESDGESVQRIELSSVQEIPFRSMQGSPDSVSSAQNAEQDPKIELPPTFSSESMDGISDTEDASGVSIQPAIQPTIQPAAPPAIQPATLPTGDNRASSIVFDRDVATPQDLNLPTTADKTAGDIPIPAPEVEEASDQNPMEQHRPHRLPTITNGTAVVKPKETPRKIRDMEVAVTNKSRFQNPDGYVYEFGLVLQENSGLRPKWQYIVGRKISDSGRSSLINTFIPEQRFSANARYQLAVAMMGNSMEDQKGRLFIAVRGVDENGSPIEFEYAVLLDDSFPIRTQSRLGLSSLIKEIKELYVRHKPF